MRTDRDKGARCEGGKRKAGDLDRGQVCTMCEALGCKFEKCNREMCLVNRSTKYEE